MYLNYNNRALQQQQQQQQQQYNNDQLIIRHNQATEDNNNYNLKRRSITSSISPNRLNYNFNSYPTSCNKNR